MPLYPSVVPFRAIGKHAKSSVDTQLLQLLGALPGLPPKEAILQHMAASVVAEYAGWVAGAILAGQEGAAGLLQQLLAMAIAALEMPESTAAVRAVLMCWLLVDCWAGVF